MWGGRGGHAAGQEKVGFRHTSFQSAPLQLVPAGGRRPRGQELWGDAHHERCVKSCLGWQTPTMLTLTALPFPTCFAEGRESGPEEALPFRLLYNGAHCWQAPPGWLLGGIGGRCVSLPVQDSFQRQR